MTNYANYTETSIQETFIQTIIGYVANEQLEQARSVTQTLLEVCEPGFLANTVLKILQNLLDTIWHEDQALHVTGLLVIDEIYEYLKKASISLEPNVPNVRDSFIYLFSQQTELSVPIENQRIYYSLALFVCATLLEQTINKNEVSRFQMLLAQLAQAVEVKSEPYLVNRTIIHVLSIIFSERERLDTAIAFSAKKAMPQKQSDYILETKYLIPFAEEVFQVTSDPLILQWLLKPVLKRTSDFTPALELLEKANLTSQGLGISISEEEISTQALIQTMTEHVSNSKLVQARSLVLPLLESCIYKQKINEKLLASTLIILFRSLAETVWAQEQTLNITGLLIAEDIYEYLTKTDLRLETDFPLVKDEFIYLLTQQERARVLSKDQRILYSFGVLYTAELLKTSLKENHNISASYIRLIEKLSSFVEAKPEYYKVNQCVIRILTSTFLEREKAKSATFLSLAAIAQGAQSAVSFNAGEYLLLFAEEAFRATADSLVANWVLEPLLKHEPNSAPILRLLQKANYVSEDLEKSRAYMVSLQALQPNTVSTQFKSALLYMANGNFLLADLILQGILKKKNLAAAFVHRIECLLAMKNYSQAWQALSSLNWEEINEETLRPIKKILRADLPNMLKEDSKGIAHEILTALSNQLEHPEWLVKLHLNYLVHKDRFQEAELIQRSYMEQLLASGVKSQEPYLRLAAMYEEDGSFEQAKEILEHGLSKLPIDAALWRRRLALEVQLNSQRAAIHLLVHSVRLKVDDVTYKRLIRVLLTIVNVNTIEILQALDPKHFDSFENLIVYTHFAFETTGELGLGKQLLEKAEVKLKSLNGKALKEHYSLDLGICQALLAAKTGQEKHATHILLVILEDPNLIFRQLTDIKKIADILHHDRLTTRIVDIVLERFINNADVALATLLVDLHQIDLALNVLTQALQDPKQEMAASKKLAHYLRFLGRYTEAELILNALLTNTPEDARLYLELAEIYLEQQKLEKALQYARIARFYAYDDNEVFSVAEFIALLYKGRYSEAWQLCQNKSINNYLSYGSLREKYAKSYQEWTKASKRLLVTVSGIGDEIRWASIYPKLKVKTNEEVAITCDPRLASIFQRSFPHLQFVPCARRYAAVTHNIGPEYSNVPHSRLMFLFDNSGWAAVNQYDRMTLTHNVLPELLSNRKSFHNNAPLLKSDLGLVEQWKAKLLTNNRPNIGITWRSDLISYARVFHYLPFPALIRLMEMYEANWYILQRDLSRDERHALESIKNGSVIFLNDAFDMMNDFENLAGVLMAMDQVIASTTSTFELAAALGVPISLISRSRIIDWRRGEQNQDIWFSNVTHCFSHYTEDPSGETLAHMLLQTLSKTSAMASQSETILSKLTALLR